MESIYDGYGLVDDTKFIPNQRINEIIVTIHNKDDKENVSFLKGILIPFNFNKYSKRK